MLNKIFTTGVLLGAFALAGQVQAVEVTVVDIDLMADRNTFADEREYSEGDINLSVTGHYSKNVRKKCRPRPSCKLGIVDRAVGSFSSYGIGVGKGRGARHMIDNKRGARGFYDMMLFTFDQSVSMDTVSAGYVGSGKGHKGGEEHNSEMSLLSYQGDNAAPTFGAGSWDDLLNNDWVGVGDYKLGTDGEAVSVVSGYTSRYWLVGAFNPNLGGNGSEYGSGFTENDDFFKLRSIGVSTGVSPVPLPGSMLLFGFALVGFGAMRRRKLLG